MGAGQSEEEIRKEVKARMAQMRKGNRKSDKKGSFEDVGAMVADSVSIGKDVLENPFSALLHGSMSTLSNIAGVAKSNSQLRKERKVLRDMVEEKKRNRRFLLQMQAGKNQRQRQKDRIKSMRALQNMRETYTELKDKDPARAKEYMETMTQQIQSTANKFNPIDDFKQTVHDMIPVSTAPKREKRRLAMDMEDAKQLLMNPLIGAIATGVRHKRQNDIYDLEDEYMQLEDEGYGSKHFVKPFAPERFVGGSTFVHDNEFIDKLRNARMNFNFLNSIH